MITSITIENFKGIGENAVTIPLRPITMLFGKNSAGKSTILHALHYLREVLEHRRPDPDRTTLGGDSVDLGGFYSLVHRHETDRRIRIRATFDISADGLEFPGLARQDGESDSSEVFQKMTSLPVKVDINTLVDLENGWIEVVTEQDKLDQEVFIAEYAVGINNSELLRMSAHPQRYPEIEAVNFNHPIFQGLNEEATEEDVESISTQMEAFIGSYGESDGTSQLARSIILSQQESIIPEVDKPFLTDACSDVDGSTVEEMDGDTTLELLFWNIVAQATTGPLKALLDELKGIRYLGPMRDVPPRNHRSPKTPDETRWARGLAAWDRMVASERLVELVNQCLRKTLALGYTLKRIKQIQLDADGDIMNEIRLLATRFEEATADDVHANILGPLEMLQSTPVIQLHDETNQVDVEPYDIGVGISQVIPVVVGALDSGDVGRRNSIFAVEQPELHVHPAVQTSLGDVFIEAVKNSDRMMLIETHSEHLVLRILRRIRESAIDSPLISVSDVAVLCAETLPEEEGAEFYEMELSEQGEILSQWPGGFFPERINEIFGGPA